MKKILPAFLLILVLAAAAAVAQTAPTAPAPAAEDPESTRAVEGAATIGAGDRAAAKKAALAQARRAALRDYMLLLVPPGILKTKAAAVEKIYADSDKLVADSQELGSREESGKLVVNFKIRLRTAEVKSRMAAAGLLPAGPLPEVFVLVRGVGMGDNFRSGWETNPPASGENECEAALAAELTRYGFTITPPRSGQADTARVLSPGNEAERAEVFRYIKDKFGSETMLVGVVTAEGEDRPRLKLRLAAADTNREKLLWSGARERIASGPETRARAEAMTGLCRAAGEEAVFALYQSRLPSLTPGAEREMVLTINGIDRWATIKEIEKKLRSELPGVISVSLSRMSPGVVEYRLRTSVATKSMAEWLATNPFGGMAMKVTEADDYRITLQAQPLPPATNPAPPGASPPAGTPSPPARPITGAAPVPSRPKN